MTAQKILAHIKLKPFFKTDRAVLYNADYQDILADIPENSIDVIFADPPYNLSNGGITVYAGKVTSVNKGDWDVSKGFDEDLDFHMRWIEACRRVLKPNGTIWITGTYHSIYQCGYALQRHDFHILNDIAWFKPNAAPNISGRYFAASHETILWARKHKKIPHIFNYLDMKGGDWHKSDFIKKEDKQMRSVWSINTPKPDEKRFGKHPTQKPLDLLIRIVASSTEPDAVVLDPFTGSSTTGVAALKLGRRFIGIDREKDYLTLSTKRLKAVQ
ncbi:MAG: site-specific DNA-methyltransferase [Minisyncoccia bacterium]